MKWTSLCIMMVYAEHNFKRSSGEHNWPFLVHSCHIFWALQQRLLTHSDTFPFRLVRHLCGLQASVVTTRWLSASWEQGPTLIYREWWGQLSSILEFILWMSWIWAELSILPDMLTCTFHLDILWCPKLCFRFLYMQDTACKTRREVMPTPGKMFYTLHEISAQEYYYARDSAGQYCRYLGISWYPVSIVMTICTVSSIKTRVVYYLWGIKG